LTLTMSKVILIGCVFVHFRQTVKPGTPPDFILKVTIERHPVRFFVHKRPHVDFFLDVISQWYDLVVFTASMEIYGAGELALATM
jgi:TFIIF-interacting CTD phosphatase-like protein